MGRPSPSERRGGDDRRVGRTDPRRRRAETLRSLLMPAQSDSHITITPDHFLGPLGLPDDPQIKPRARHELFVAVVQHLRERGLVAGMQNPPAQESTRLDLLVPGTP